jgi:glucose/arabinose dehydrogenase
LPYAIPDGNHPSSLPEIWATGLRNPWRFSFDRATGDLFIGDVGQNQWEEIHLLPAGIIGGTNLGWDYFEGNHAFEGTPPKGASFVSPILEYSHSGGNCSVTGGYVYRGEKLTDWQGVYLFGDYCSGTIWVALPTADGTWSAEQAFQLPIRLVSFGEDQDGEIYLIDLSGTIFTLTQK